jgi:hypothetical protein
MAQVALFIGVKNGVREIIDQGDPRDMRVKFKTSPDGMGFDYLEVFESTVGRSRRRSFLAKSEKIDQPETPEPEIEEVEEIDIEELKEIASGDGRKPEVKEARKTLDELGIEY